MVAAIVVCWAGAAAGQSTAHHSKSKTKAAVVQPDSGAPPDQAVEPDASAPLAQTPNYDPPPPPPRAPDPDPPPPPPVKIPQPAAPPPIAEAEKPAPMRFMTPEEKQLEQDSTQLLTLVRELKEEVAKAGIDTLSLSALRKADEIQRLSKTLKERLKLQAQAVANKGQ